nr:MAG TPA: hypothetical protein [Caudoviricetes sp.]
MGAGRDAEITRMDFKFASGNGYIVVPPVLFILI